MGRPAPAGAPPAAHGDRGRRGGRRRAHARGGDRLSRAPLAAALLLGALLGSVAVTLSARATTEVTTVADGTVEVTATDGDLRVTLTGPSR